MQASGASVDKQQRAPDDTILQVSVASKFVLAGPMQDETDEDDAGTTEEPAAAAAAVGDAAADDDDEDDEALRLHLHEAIDAAFARHRLHKQQQQQRRTVDDQQRQAERRQRLARQLDQEREECEEVTERGRKSQRPARLMLEPESPHWSASDCNPASEDIDLQSKPAPVTFEPCQQAETFDESDAVSTTAGTRDVGSSRTAETPPSKPFKAHGVHRDAAATGRDRAAGRDAADLDTTLAAATARRSSAATGRDQMLVPLTPGQAKFLSTPRPGTDSSDATPSTMPSLAAAALHARAKRRKHARRQAEKIHVSFFGTHVRGADTSTASKVVIACNLARDMFSRPFEEGGMFGGAQPYRLLDVVLRCTRTMLEAYDLHGPSALKGRTLYSTVEEAAGGGRRFFNPETVAHAVRLFLVRHAFIEFDSFREELDVYKGHRVVGPRCGGFIFGQPPTTQADALPAPGSSSFLDRKDSPPAHECAPSPVAAVAAAASPSAPPASPAFACR